MADLFTDPPAVVRPAEDLSAIFGRAKASYHKLEVSKRQMLDAANEVGKELIAAKARVKHGEWLPTLAKYWPGISKKDVYICIKIAENWRRVRQCETIREALALLASEEEEREKEEPQISPVEKFAGDSNPNSGQRMNTKPPSEPQPRSNGSANSTPRPSAPSPPTPPTPPTPPPVRTKAEQIKAKLEQVRDHLSEANFGLSAVATGPMGPLMLQLAEEMGFAVTKEFHGARDRFDRESQIHGERVYFWQDIEKFGRLLDAVAVKLERGEEIEF